MQNRDMRYLPSKVVLCNRGKSYDDQTEDKYELKNRSKGTTVH